MIITAATSADCPELAHTSKRAFESDPAVGAPEPGGPPGYDSTEWHEAALAWGRVFTISHDGRPVGGAIVFLKSPSEARLARIWFVPEAQHQGLGRVAMTTLESMFPDVTRWTLDTPVWNKRNQHFYARCGYRLIGAEGKDGLLFEKWIAAPSAGR